MNALQDNIKRQLHAKNMTAAELERRTGLPHAVINILHGRSKNPSIRTAQAIAKELGCSIEELFGNTTEIATSTSEPPAWNMQLYSAAFQALCKQVEASKLQPSPEQMSQWLTDIYKYSLGAKDAIVDARKDAIVDARFVQWLLER